MLFVHKTTYLTCADNCQPVLVGLYTFSRHSPTLFPGLATFADIRQPFSPDSIHSTHIRQPFFPDSIHSTDIRQGSFWKNVTHIRHIRTSNSPFWQIWGEWPLLTINTIIIWAHREGRSYFTE